MRKNNTLVLNSRSNSLAHVMANDRTVMQSLEENNGVTLGGVEIFFPQHFVRTTEDMPRMTVRVPVLF